MSVMQTGEASLGRLPSVLPVRSSLKFPAFLSEANDRSDVGLTRAAGSRPGGLQHEGLRYGQ